MDHGIQTAGKFRVQCVRPDGRLKWQDDIRNAATLEGLTDLLSAFLAGGTQRSWSVGIISGAAYSAVSSADTAASHAGWAEFTGYSGDRKSYAGLSVAGGVCAPAAAAQFTLTSAGSLRGFFLASNATKGSTSGVLWCTGLFAAARALEAGETLRVTYSVRASGG